MPELYPLFGENRYGRRFSRHVANKTIGLCSFAVEGTARGTGGRKSMGKEIRVPKDTAMSIIYCTVIELIREGNLRISADLLSRRSSYATSMVKSFIYNVKEGNWIKVDNEKYVVVSKAEKAGNLVFKLTK